MDKRSMTKSEIEKYRFHNEKYNVTGSWICSDSTVDIMFFTMESSIVFRLKQYLIRITSNGLWKLPL